ncbi:type III toxin-antitoxin system CptIN family toxin [Paenibacillus wynnii]|uniref:type III toxin-antitoxin system CptIN family toxin n=1 Tax=Paenibacillus wynnii TaxID=268407 RepID=UPI00278E1961|nr:hypothetical protein [Paenibacillus wynnii]MDQ0194431.1 hypothetical protein [Paenibacillus wynnii]
METIVDGNFYFVHDKYFIDFPDNKLMSNKETIAGVEHNRPCFYSFVDVKTGINWFIPISSQVKKFQGIYNKKILAGKVVDTIVFGFVMGNKKAFLIQNMFPVTQNYIFNEYIDSVTKAPVTINEKLKKELNSKGKKVLGLHRKGIFLIFPDVLKIETQLLDIQVATQRLVDEAAISVDMSPFVPRILP